MAVKSVTTPEPSYDAIDQVYREHKSQTSQPFFITEASLTEVRSMVGAFPQSGRHRQHVPLPEDRNLGRLLG